MLSAELAPGERGHTVQLIILQNFNEGERIGFQEIFELRAGCRYLYCRQNIGRVGIRSSWVIIRSSWVIIRSSWVILDLRSCSGIFFGSYLRGLRIWFFGSGSGMLG